METPKSFYGCGDAFFDRRVDGQLTGLRAMGSMSKLELGAKNELEKQTGRGRTTQGKTIASVTKPGEDIFSATMDQVARTNLALAILGTVLADNQASGSVLEGSPLAVVAHPGRLLEIGYEEVSALVVKDETDTTTHVLGTDYLITNARLGLIEPIEGGGISEGDILHLSFAYAAVTRNKIDAGSDIEINGRFVLDGINLATEEDVKVVIEDLQITPSSIIDFLSGKFNTINIEGTCRVTDGNPPFTVYTYPQ